MSTKDANRHKAGEKRERASSPRPKQHINEALPDLREKTWMLNPERPHHVTIRSLEHNSLLQLQRSVGNRAVTTEIIQRKPVKLSADDRAWLYGAISGRMSRAYTRFVDACNDVKSDLKEAAAREAAFVKAIGEIALGGLFPALSGAIASAAKKVPASSITLRAEMARMLVDKAKVETIMKDIWTAGKGVVDSSAPKVSKKASAGTEEEFIDELKKTVDRAWDTVYNNLKGKPDSYLMTVWAAYDVDLTGKAKFKGQINGLVNKWKTEVKPIGAIHYTGGRGGVTSTRKRVANVVQGKTVKPALITEEESTSLGGPGKDQGWIIKSKTRYGGMTATSMVRYTFISWISDEMKETAAERMKSKGLKTISVKHAEVVGLGLKKKSAPSFPWAT